MRLALSTDYALRLLMLVGLEPDRLVTIEEVADRFVQRASSTPPSWSAALFGARCPAASTVILTAEPDENIPGYHGNVISYSDKFFEC
jgi:hypothetical protein